MKYGIKIIYKHELLKSRLSHKDTLFEKRWGILKDYMEEQQQNNIWLGYCIHICTSAYIFHVFLYTPEIPVNPCMILIYASGIAVMFGEQENKQKRPVSFF